MKEIALESTIFDCMLSGDDAICEIEGCDNDGKCVNNIFNCQSNECLCDDCNGIELIYSSKTTKKPSPWSRLITMQTKTQTKTKTSKKHMQRVLLPSNFSEEFASDEFEGISSTDEPQNAMSSTATMTYAFDTTTTSELTQTSKVAIVKEKIINVKSNYFTTFSLLEYIVIGISVMLCGGTCLIFLTVCYCHRVKDSDVKDYSHHEIKNHELIKGQSNSSGSNSISKSKNKNKSKNHDGNAKKKTTKKHTNNKHKKKKKPKTGSIAHAQEDSTIVKLKSQVYHHSTQSLNDSETSDEADDDADQGEQHHKMQRNNNNNNNRRKNRSSQSQSQSRSFSANRGRIGDHRHKNSNNHNNKAGDVPPPPPLPPRPPVRLDEYQNKMVSARQQRVRTSRSQRTLHSNNHSKSRGNRRHKHNKTFNSEFGPNPGAVNNGNYHQSANTMSAVMVPQHHHHIYYVSPDNNIVNGVPNGVPFDAVNSFNPGAPVQQNVVVDPASMSGMHGQAPHQQGVSYSYSIVANAPPGANGMVGMPQQQNPHEIPAVYNAFYAQAHPSQQHLMQVQTPMNVGQQQHHMNAVQVHHPHMMGHPQNMNNNNVQRTMSINNQSSVHSKKMIRKLETPHYNDNNNNKKSKNRNRNNSNDSARVIRRKRSKGEKKNSKRNVSDLTDATVTTPTIEFGKNNLSWKCNNNNKNNNSASLHVPKTSTQVTATTLTSVTTSAMTSSCATPTSDTDATSAITPTSDGSQTEATSMYTETQMGDDDDDDDEDGDTSSYDQTSRKTTDVTDSTYMRSNASKKKSTICSEATTTTPISPKKYKPRPRPIDVGNLNSRSVGTVASSAVSSSSMMSSVTATTLKNSEHHTEASAALNSVLNDIISEPKSSIDDDCDDNGNNNNNNNRAKHSVNGTVVYNNNGGGGGGGNNGGNQSVSKKRSKNGNDNKGNKIQNDDNMSETTKSSLSPHKYLKQQNSDLSVGNGTDLFSPSASHTPVPETFYPGSSKDSKQSTAAAANK